ncbi:MAG: protein kinase [Terriglobales bacterium]|jgi:serine/threonine protein kinase/tetratricopeptide (TPR) repeat protein
MELTPQQWENVKALFESALEKTPAERSSFLNSAAADSQVRHEVERLLAHYVESGGFLSDPAIPRSSTSLARRPSQSFLPNDFLAERFRIRRFLARGGMGEVYEAEDAELRERVALKSIRSELLHDGRVLERFKREVNLARKVTHPNVCRIFDLFRQPGKAETSTSPSAVVFVTMELLEGETLAEFLRRQPHLSTDDAQPIALQMAAGLGAAHSAGVVHRDFKPGNVLLVQSNKGMRAVITDFGLALRSTPDLSLGVSVTGTGEVLGTPAYMAPEQVEGKGLTPASDVYSFGLVLYQMVTGTRAFEDTTPLAMAVRRIQESPIPPRTLVPNLDRRWEFVILKCLERDPRDRFQNGDEVADALRGETKHRGKWRSKTPVLLGSLALITALAIGGLYVRSHRSKPPLTDEDSILVSDFENRTGDPVFDDTLKKGLLVALEQSPFLNILPGRTIKEALLSMGRSADEAVTVKTGLEICVRTGGAAVLGASVAKLGSEYVLDLNAVNCQSGESLAAVEETAASKEKVLAALDRAATQVRKRLGESLSSVQRFAAPVEQATTPSLEALKVFSLASKAQSEKGDAESIPLLKRAIALDPSFAMAYTGLATSYSNLGETGLAREYIEKAYELRNHTSELEKIRIDAFYYDLVAGDLTKDLETFELWAQEYPRSEAAHINLGSTYFALGHYDRALTEDLKATELVPDDGVNYANLIGAYAALNRLDEAKGTYQKALARHLDSSQVRSNEYGVAFLEGDTSEMAEQLEWASGKPGVEDVFLSLQSDTEAFHGHADKAREFSWRAVESAKQNDEKEIAAQWRLESALREAEFGNRAKARKEAAQALSLAPTRDVQALAALVFAQAGDSAHARSLANDLEKRFPQNTMIKGYWLPSVRAAIEIERNNPSKAIELLRAAAPYDLANPSPGPGGLLQPVYTRGQAYLLLHQGDRAAAEFQRFHAYRGVVGNDPLGALAYLGMARAAVVEGNRGKARAAYEDFLTLWTDADPGIPVLRQARTEYAKLQ